MLFTVAEGWAMAGFTALMVGGGVAFMYVERYVRAWLDDRSRESTRQLFIAAERQYNEQNARVSGTHIALVR